MTDETIQDRVERAQSQTMEMTLVDTDPVVVQVYNEESDRIHTVVPQSVHCSCEDHTYRGAICKHIITLLDAQGHVGDLMRGYLKEHRADLESEANETKDRLDDLLFQCEQITGVLTELDVDQDLERTDEAGMRLLQEGAEVGDAAVVEDDPVDQSPESLRSEIDSTIGDGADGESPKEARTEFESMVADLTGDGA